MLRGIFSSETYAETRRPLAEASTLPHWCYHDPEWYAREEETILKREWLCVGRVDQVPSPGDFYTIPVLGHPLIVVRDDAGEVNVLTAICRHRGAVIAEDAQRTRCRAFICPYHGWTYGLDGGLISTPGNPPPLAGVKNFAHSDNGLVRMRSDVWAGFLFVTFDPDAPPLLKNLGDLPALLRNYHVEDMQFTHRDVYEVDCNWKVWLENAFESYHAMIVHRKHMDPANPQVWQHETGAGFISMYSERSAVAYSGLPNLPGLSKKESVGLYHVWVPPTLQLIVTPSYLKYRQYLSEGPEKLRLIENWSFPKSTIGTTEFEETVGPAYYDRYNQIIHEDLSLAPVVQRGLRSGGFKPGRYTLDEYIVHGIGNYVLDRVVGPDEARSRARRASVMLQAAD
jgi:choline monooxygenase